MQIIPIIISEKVLKKAFFEVIDQINSYSTFNYELIEEYSERTHANNAIILDGKILKKLPIDKTKNQKLFVINDNVINLSNQKNNQIFIDRPFKIIDLLNLVENDMKQVEKREQKKMKFNQHVFDPIGRTLHKDKKFIRLTEKESEIFNNLVENSNKFVNKKYLLQKVWKYSQDVDTHTLETHLYSLRKKIDQILETKNLIIHEEKKGYLINLELL